MASYRSTYQSIADQAAASFGIPPNIFSAMITKESGWNPTAKASGSSAYGLGQLTTAAANQVGADVYDPTSNLYGAAAYLAAMPGASSGDWQTALGSYNQGPAGYQGAGRAAGDAYASSVLAAAGQGGDAVGSGGFSVGFMPDGATAGAGASSGAAGADSAGSIAGAINGAGTKISDALGSIGAPFKTLSDAISSALSAAGDFFKSLTDGRAWEWIKTNILIAGAILLLALLLLWSGANRAANA